MAKVAVVVAVAAARVLAQAQVQALRAVDQVVEQDAVIEAYLGKKFLARLHA